MKILRWLNRYSEELLLVAMLVAMVVVEVLQIFMRRVMGSSLSWAEELVRYLFIWSGFLSISFTIRNQSAMRLTMVVAALPRAIRHAAIALVYIVMVVFFGYMSVVAYIQLGSMHQTSPALGISMVYIYLAPLLGFVLTTVRCIQVLWVVFRSFGQKHFYDIILETAPESGNLIEGKEGP